MAHFPVNTLTSTLHTHTQYTPQHSYALYTQHKQHTIHKNDGGNQHIKEVGQLGPIITIITIPGPDVLLRRIQSVPITFLPIQ